MKQLLLASGVIDPALIAWPNEPFIQPEPPAIWVAVEATGDACDPIEMPALVYRETGSAYFHVFTPANCGTDGARLLAKQIFDIYRGLGPREVVYRGGSIGNSAIADTEGMWSLITVAVEYQYDDRSS